MPRRGMHKRRESDNNAMQRKVEEIEYNFLYILSQKGRAEVGTAWKLYLNVCNSIIMIIEFFVVLREELGPKKRV